MAKRLAIEWDSRELRVVAGTIKADRVTITDIISTPIESSDPQALGETLKRLLNGAGLEKLGAGMALGRGKVELRELRLPPVPEAELPEMVRFQAIRTFAAAGDKSAIDYLPVSRDAEGIKVVAAAATPDELKKCALIAVPSQTSVDKLILRPLAAASLYRHSGQPIEGETVLIDLLADEADVVVLRDGVLAFVRSIRVPDEIATRVRSLSGEVRRSMMACHDESMSDDMPRRVIMWGKRDVHQEELTGLSQALNTDVQALDPMSLVGIDDRLAGNIPDHTGRLAPLIGLLDAEIRGNADIIDFLNPRKTPEPPSPVGRYVAIGFAAVLAAGLLFYVANNRLSTLDAEIAAKQTLVDSMEEPVKKAEDTIARTAAVDQFLDGNVFWLEEMRRIAEQLPPADAAILTGLTASTDTRSGGGVINLSVGVNQPGVLSELASSLRDDDHVVVTGTTRLQSSKKPYDVVSTASIAVGPEHVREVREVVFPDPTPASADATSAAVVDDVAADTSPSDREDVDEAAEPVESEAATGASQDGESQPSPSDPVTPPESETPNRTEPTINTDSTDITADTKQQAAEVGATQS